MAGLNRRSAFAAAVLPLLVLAMTGWARAATLIVTNTTDPVTPVAGDGSLRGELLAAGSGDTIVFAPGLSGTIDLLAANGSLGISTSITITGPTTPPGIAISGQSATRVIVVSSLVTASIANLTIEHGSTGNGAGILNNGTLTVTNCTFSDNSASAFGGGISNEGTLTVINSTFSGNSAESGGGGLFNDGASTATVTDSTLSDNTTGETGGGINNGGTLTVTNSAFTSNTAFDAGGIENVGTLTVVNSTFSGNSANTLGGGILNNGSGGTLTVTNSTFSGNSAKQGGGILNNDSTLAITNSTFSGNSATVAGGGIVNSAGTLAVKGTILAAEPTGGNCGGTITDAGYNISDDGTCGFVSPSVNNSTTLNLDPAGLQNNGGPTQTIAIEPNSQALNFIPIANCKDQSSNPLIQDQRDFPRPDSGNLSFCDAGAFELQQGRLIVEPDSERTEIARSSNPNSDQVDLAFTFADLGSPLVVYDEAAPDGVSNCGAGNDALNGVSVDLFAGTCADIGSGGLLLNLTPFVVHTIGATTYGTIFQSSPTVPSPETVLARIVQSRRFWVEDICGEWTLNIEVAGLDTAALNLGGSNPFALVLEDGDKNEGCFDVHNAVVGGQNPTPPHGVRRGSRRGRKGRE